MSSSLQAELKQNKPFALPEEELFIGLFRTIDLLGRATSQLLKQYDLSSAQYNVLRILRGAEPDGMPCGEVGSRMVTRDPDITRLLDRMEKRQWVIRIRVSTDRRVITARITENGMKLLEVLDTPMLELHRQQLGFLSRPEIQSLMDSLDRIRQNLAVKE